MRHYWRRAVTALFPLGFAGSGGVLRWRQQNGQIAAVFVAVMVLVLLFAVMTMNLGQTAKLKTAVSNTADAAALAAASWIASGANEIVYVARGMSINAMIVQLVFVIPFCWEACAEALGIYAALLMANNLYLHSTANQVGHGAFDMAHAGGFQAAMSNAPIDAKDAESIRIQHELRAISNHFRSTEGDLVGGGMANPDRPGEGTIESIGGNGSFSYTTSWDRLSTDGRSYTSTLNVSTVFSNSEPGLSMGGDWGPTFICWSPKFFIPISNNGGCAAVEQTCCLCICLTIYYYTICPECVWPSFTAWGWQRPNDDAESTQQSSESSEPTSVDGSQASSASFFSGIASQLQAFGKAWSGSVGQVVPNDLTPGTCTENDQTCLPIPGSAGGEVCPGNISDGSGDVTVTVTLSRSGAGSLPFWQTRAPVITSSATAHYAGASVGGCFDWHSPDAFAHLTDVTN